MQRLTSIVAVNHQGVIGCGNALPWRLKTDMRFFKDQTTDNIVLMGRKTYDSLGKKPLPHRYNVVISHSFGLFPETLTCKSATGIEDGLFRASLAPKAYKDAFVVGGASMYEQFVPYVDRYLITLVDKIVERGDTFFDQEFLGDPELWNIENLRSVPSGEDDEASFSIFEVTSKHPGEFHERRVKAIELAREAATLNAPTRLRAPKSRKAAVEPLNASYSML